jgi:hypothetical protein
VTFGDANAPSTTAGFALSGTYILRLTAGDGALTAYDDVVVSVSDAGSGGGSLAAGSAAAPASVNLSAEGAADWAHWGLSSAGSFNRKAGVAPQISNYAPIGTGAVLRYTNNPNLYSWTGGTPTASAANTPTGIYVVGVGNGFRITAPADATPRTLKVYVGVWAAGGRLEAALSDGSAPAYADASLANASGTSNWVYTLDYRAASPGQTLTVRWTANTVSNQWSNVTLQAATLR